MPLFVLNILKSPYLYISIGVLFLSYQIYNTGYQSGYDSCKTEWNKSIDDNKKLLEKQQLLVDKDRADLNNRLSVLGEQLTKTETQLAQKQSESIKEVIKYVKTPAANVKCLDDEWVRSFNASLPSTTETTN